MRSITAISFAVALNLLVPKTCSGQEVKEYCILVGHTSNVNCVAFSPDSRTIASGGSDNVVLLWEVATGKQRAALKGHRDLVTCVAFSPNGGFLISGDSSGKILHWDLATMQCYATVAAYSDIDGVRKLAFAPDGTYFASGGSDGTLKFWHADSAKLLKTIRAHNDVVNTLAFSGDGKLLASGSRDSVIKIWNPDRGTEIAEIQEGARGTGTFAFKLDGAAFISSNAYGSAHIWDVPNRKILQKVEVDPEYLVNRLVARSDWKLFAMAGGDPEKSDYRIRFFNSASGKTIIPGAGHNDYVISMVFSSNGRYLATGSRDKTVRIWSICCE